MDKQIIGRRDGTYINMNCMQNIGDVHDTVFTEANSNACVQEMKDMGFDNALVGTIDTSTLLGLNFSVNKKFRDSLTTIATND